MNCFSRRFGSLFLLSAVVVGPALGAGCVTIPPGLVGWWQGEGSTADVQGQFPGTVLGGGSYVPGLVGQAFDFNGTDSAVQLGSSPAFNLQNFTIEAWVRRASAERPSQAAPYFGCIIGGGANHFALAMYPDGRMTLGKVGVSNADSSRAVTGTEWHHVIATKNNSLVEFYIDGQPAGSATQSATFSFETPLAIGALGQSYPGVGTEPFWGAIDEASLYDRALTSVEVAAIYHAGVSGKCVPRQNLITNGGFEQPAYTSADGIPPAGMFVRTRNLPGWEVAPSAGALDIELANFSGTVAAEGVQCVDLEGVESLPAYFIRQDVAVVAGRSYRLEFAYAKNPAQALSRMRLELTGASVGNREFEHSTANSRANPGWVRGDLDFVATAGMVGVQFTGISPNSGYGMLLDDVSLVEVPLAPLNVANPSFELLAGTDPAHFDAQGKLLPGHYSASPGTPGSPNGFLSAEAIPGWTTEISMGTINYTGTSYFPSGTPDGQNVSWINIAGTVSQTLADVFEADRLYRLTVNVGFPAGVGFPGYYIGLYAGGEPVARDENSVAVAGGAFSEATVSVRLAAGSPHIGKPIQIRLGIPGSKPDQVNFDNVRLVAESSETPPECVSAIPGLAAWYRGEGTAEDWLGTYPAAFAQPKYGAGKVSQAFDFDGSNEVVVLNAPVFNRDTFTLEAWIFPTSLDGAVDIIVNKEAGSDFGQFQFELGIKGPVNDVAGQIPLGNLAFYLAGITGLPDEYGGWVDGRAAAPLNQWTHVALAVEPGTVSVHVNGLETRRLTGLGGTLQMTSGPLKIGSRHEAFVNPRPGERFNGRIDEFSFYTRKLAGAEIAALFRSGSSGRCSEDLELHLTGPAKVALNEDFLITARLANLGVSDATLVTLTNVIPSGVSVLAITNSQGQTVNHAGVVISDLGTIPGRKEATVHFLCRALLAGPYQISASVGRGEADLLPENNRQTLTFEAVPLTLAVGPDVAVTEGANPVAEITVSLSAPVGRPITVDYLTVKGTAKAGRDFTAVAGTLTIPPGSSGGGVTVPIANDAFFEAEESFTLILTNAVGASLIRSNAVVTITSDDPRPLLRIGDAIVREGNGGPTNALLKVTLTGASEEPVTVGFTTLNGTALSPTDYLATNGVLAFPPGVAEATFAVRVNGDTVVEPNESLFLNLTDATNAEIADIVGTVAIVNDDFIPGQVATFAWEPVASPKELGKPFAAQFSAHDGGGNVVADFNGVVQLAATGDGKRPTSVVISEVDTGDFDSVEFTNVSTNTVDVSGWTAFIYDAISWPLPKGSFTLPLGSTVAPGAVFRVMEGTSPTAVFPNVRAGFLFHWGLSDGLAQVRPVAVLWRDALGGLVDFFCAGEAVPQAIAVPAFVPADEWTGLPLSGSTMGFDSYQRQGSADHDGPADWISRFPSANQRNPGLTVPFTDSQPLMVAPEFALDFTAGVWSGNLQVNGFAPLVSLLADDGNGHVGFSAPFALTAPNDLAVSLTVTPDRAVNPAQEIRYLATVTNPGPDISSNVVMEVRLDAYFGRIASQVLRAVEVSQGATETDTYLVVGSPFGNPALRITASFGEIPAGGFATLAFEATRMSFANVQSLPTNIVTTATVNRTQPDFNPFNNTATARFEVSTACVVLADPSLLMGWWRGEGNGLDSIRGNHLTVEGEGSFVGAGRVGDQSLRFTAGGPRLSAPNAASLNFTAAENFTFEAWVRLSPGTPRGRQTLLDKRGPATGAGYVWFIEQGRLGMTLVDGSGATFTALSPVSLPGSVVPDLRNGRWHHVAAVVSRQEAARLTLYVNGAQAGFNMELAVPGDLTTAASLRFGHDFAASPETAFEGELDEVTIYRTALVASGIQSIYRAGAAGKCVSDLALSVTTPELNGALFTEPLFFGRPVVVSLLLTNAGPLAVPATWLQAELLRDYGTTRLLTLPLATNVFNEFTTYHDFGPLAAGASLSLQTEITLTNPPPNLRANYTAFLQFTGIESRRGGIVSADFQVNPDRDADGMRDDWELANGFNPDDPGDALVDADGDGASNVQEFLTGTGPRDAADRLRLELVSHTDILVAFRVATKTGHGYQLLRAVGSAAAEWTVVTDVIAGTGGVLEFSDPNPPVGDVFYRLLVE